MAHSLRLFVAIRFPESVAEQLEDIAYGLPGAGWLPAEQYHLTLRFIGDPGTLTVSDLDAALRTVRAEAFHFDLKGSGHFPLRGAPEVVWAGVDSNEALSRLRNRVEAALTRAGVPPEGRKFHPHVTLARVKDAQERDIAAWQARTGLFRLPDIPVQEFHLFSSVLKPHGAEHTVEATYPLDGVIG